MENKKKIKIAFVISTVDFSYGMKWLAMHMPKDKYEVVFIFLYSRTPELHKLLLERNINSIHLKYNGKNDLPRICFSLFRFFLRFRPHIVHAHLFEASLAALIASKLALVPVFLYTRHHASIHHDNFPNAVKYDRMLNRYSKKIIAISDNVKSILQELDKASANKLELIHHGFDFDEFEINAEDVKHLKAQYTLGDHHPVVGVISRFTHFKGVQYIIPAFKKLLKTYPDAVLVLANAIGDYKAEIMKLLEDLPAANYRMIEFEQNVFALYKCFDVFVHTPINAQVEAFGQIYIEAMALEVPVVCTPSGIAFEFIKPDENAVVVDFCNSDAITVGIRKILENEELRNKIILKAKEDVKQYFDVKMMIDKLDRVYDTLIMNKIQN